MTDRFTMLPQDDAHALAFCVLRASTCPGKRTLVKSVVGNQAGTFHSCVLLQAANTLGRNRAGVTLK